MDRAEEIAQAVAYHRTGRMQEAHDIYARILGEDPDCPQALNFMGILYSQQGKPEIAVQLLQRAIHTATDYADAHSNLGNVLVELGDVPNAIASYRNALICDPAQPAAHNNLGVLLRREGELHESIQHSLQSVALEPDWATAHLSLGNAYAQMGYADRAIKHYRRAVELDPSLSDAQRMLGHFLAARGDRAGAARTFRRLLDLDPENVVARHMLAANSGQAAPERASRAYIEETFDQFASSFEKKLAQLDYCGPELIAEEMAKRLPAPSNSLRVLDLGCGTGLCSSFVRGWARELVGVDLSAKMLERASQRETYDQLVEADLVEYLVQSKQPFDLMLSADVLIYFGELGEIFRAAARRLLPGGWLFFSTEKWEDESGSGDGYQLEPHGRYAHTEEYLGARLASAGLELVSIREEVVRTEMKEDVPGWLVAARKPLEAG